MCICSQNFYINGDNQHAAKDNNNRSGEEKEQSSKKAPDPQSIFIL